MTSELRQILVQRETDRARHHLAQADEMLTLGHWDMAANRQYYSCYHAVQALFVSHEVSGATISKDEVQSLSELTHDFVETVLKFIKQT